MKIAILTMGSRGDVQPYAILGQALMQRGHEVTLSTAKNFEDLVKAYGIEFKAVQADYQQLLDSDEGKKLLGANPFVIKRNLDQWIYPLVEQSLQVFYDLAIESDKVIFHVKTMAQCFADQFPDKMICAMVVPAVQKTSAFANPAFSGLKLPKFLNGFTYKLNNLGLRMMKKPISKFRSANGLAQNYVVPTTKFMYGISEIFLPKPHDYPSNAIFSGFWFHNNPKPLPSDLAAFIAQGSAPVVITFGSMPFKSKLNLVEAIDNITKQLNIRIILVKGWGLAHMPSLEHNERIKVVEAVQYEKLFPLVKAVIHHGGIGTVAQCLRAGVPFLVCPVLYPVGDQMFWGNLAYKLGFALKPIPLKHLTEQQLTQSIEKLISDKEIAARTIIVSEQLSKESGLQQAIAFVEGA